MNKASTFFKANWRGGLIFLLLTLSVVFAGVLVLVAATRQLSSLETVLFQLLILGAGLSGSFWFGRISAAQAARDVIRPHARSALRTIISLQESMLQLSGKIEDYKHVEPDHRLDVIQSVVNEQIPMGLSAIGDWHDIVPEDVQDVYKQINLLREDRSNGAKD